MGPAEANRGGQKQQWHQCLCSFRESGPSYRRNSGRRTVNINCRWALWLKLARIFAPLSRVAMGSFGSLTTLADSHLGRLALGIGHVSLGRLALEA